jgi:hypothetical protein
MSQKPDTFRSLIHTLGGVKAFADRMGISEHTAKKMRDRSSVHVDHWPMLIQVSKEHGGLLFTTDDFVRMSSFRTVEKRRPKAEQTERAA